MGGASEEAFIQQFKELRRSIEGYFVNRGCKPEDAEELAQKTFLQAYQGLETYRGDAKLKTWLFSIARNVFNREIRDSKVLKRDGREESIEELEQAQPPGSPLASTEHGRPRGIMGEQLSNLLTEEKLEQVQEAMLALPPRTRRCLQLYIFQERKYREIAGILGTSINTVKSHIHEARKRLKKQLGDDFDGLGR